MRHAIPSPSVPDRTVRHRKNRRNVHRAASPYLLEDTAFTIEEIRRARAA